MLKPGTKYMITITLGIKAQTRSGDDHDFDSKSIVKKFTTRDVNNLACYEDKISVRFGISIFLWLFQAVSHPLNEPWTSSQGVKCVCKVEGYVPECSSDTSSRPAYTHDLSNDLFWNSETGIIDDGSSYGPQIEAFEDFHRQHYSSERSDEDIVLKRRHAHRPRSHSRSLTNSSRP